MSGEDMRPEGGQTCVLTQQQGKAERVFSIVQRCLETLLIIVLVALDTGTVADPPSAIRPNAHIRIMGEQKGYLFTAKTDSAGRYLFRNVTPGTYTVAVEAQGFRTQEQMAFNQNVALNYTMQVGATTDTIELTEVASVLSTEDAAVSGLTFLAAINLFSGVIFFTLPSKEQIEDAFSRLRALLWGVFEVLLLLLAMVAVVMIAWRHVRSDRR